MLDMSDGAKSGRYIITMPPDLTEQVDEYRRQQAEIPNRSSAIRDLIRKGLERDREEREGKAKKSRSKP